jgi:hypothetical protein
MEKREREAPRHFQVIGRNERAGQETRIMKTIKRRLHLREDFLGFLPGA